MMTLPANASLRDLQQYVHKTEEARGFADESVMEKCLLLGEEIGELFKAVRERSGLGVDSSRRRRHVAEELADVLIVVVAIANRYDICLEDALREKEKRNGRRSWSRISYEE